MSSTKKTPTPGGTTSSKKPTSSSKPTLSTGSIKPTPSSTPTTSRPSSPVKPSTTTPAQPPRDLASLIGLELRLTIASTIEGEGDKELNGALWTYDSASSFVVIASPSPSSTSPSTSSKGKSTLTFLKSSSIKSVTVLSLTPSSLVPPLNTPLPSISPQSISSKLSSAISLDIKERARKGQNVTEEAQMIFDAFERTLPVRWDGDRIIVLETVVISSPYGVEDVKGIKGSQEAVERVKKMVSIKF